MCRRRSGRDDADDEDDVDDDVDEDVVDDDLTSVFLVKALMSSVFLMKARCMDRLRVSFGFHYNDQRVARSRQ